MVSQTDTYVVAHFVLEILSELCLIKCVLVCTLECFMNEINTLYNQYKPLNSNRTCDLPCTKCGLNVSDKDSMISFGGQVWHPHCFV